MRAVLISFLLFVGMLSSVNYAQTNPQIIMSDFFVFKTGNEIYTHEDLKERERLIGALKCWYPEAQVVRYYAKKLKVPGKDLKAWRSSSSLKPFVHFVKMIRYAKAQSAQVKPELIAALITSAKNSGCPRDGIQNENSLTEAMMSIIELEVYLRSRFESYNQSSLASLEESVERQIDHEYFGEDKF